MCSTFEHIALLNMLKIDQMYTWIELNDLHGGAVISSFHMY
jgi:hypothetical protein